MPLVSLLAESIDPLCKYPLLVTPTEVWYQIPQNNVLVGKASKLQLQGSISCSRFFIAPLLKTDSAERELNAPCTVQSLSA